MALMGALFTCNSAEAKRPLDAEAIVVGAGIAGLSAAVEMGRAGVAVLVLDMNSVPGGHAVLAGGFAIVDTPLQERAGYEDSPELAYKDWMAWTDGGDPQWTRFYAYNSRAMIYDWLAGMGVAWTGVVHIGKENSVPRFHHSKHGALDTVLALMRTALELPNVNFLWNQCVEHLIIENGRVTGVKVLDLRTGEALFLKSGHTVLATGGFEGNLERVLQHWMPDMPKPERLLIGASVHARGQGLDLAAEAGADFAHLDRHYIYTNGIIDIRDAQGIFSITVSNEHSMWVNSGGKRFTNEAGPDKTILADLLRQRPATYWAIFDEPARGNLRMEGVEWIKMPSEDHPVLDNTDITAKALTLQVLARMTGLPSAALVASVEKYNAMIDMGEDTDFGRFSKSNQAPPKIEHPPFYAIRFFPNTRKSMGGVAIDMHGRVLNSQGGIVPGLYAVGELTGSVGINGKHGMAGMFLGPAVVTGRIAGQTIVAAAAERKNALDLKTAPWQVPLPGTSHWYPSLLTARDLAGLLATRRDGYWHFEKSHELVLEQKYECNRCHSATVPFFQVKNRAGKRAQMHVCTNCHGKW